MPRLIFLMAVLGAGLGCGSDLPTSGKDIWGRNEGELEVISIGSTLSEIAADSRRPYLYAADFDQNLLYVISSATHRIEKQVAIGPRPSDLALRPDGTLLYVALLGGAEIAIVHLGAQEKVGRIPLSFSPGYLVAASPPYLYVTSSLELEASFTDDGQTYFLDSRTGIVEKVLPPVGLLEIDEARSRLYIAVHDRIYQYDVVAQGFRYLKQVLAEGPIVELSLGADGSQIYSISAGPLVEPASIISHGLINSRHNLEVDMVEVFATDGLIKVGELHTGAFPRAVAGDRERIVVAASDAPRTARSSGFAISYDATTLKPLATYRLVGSPTGCAALNAEGEFYVAIDNPYDLRERFSDRQDLQIVRLEGAGEKVPDRAGAVSTEPPPALTPSIQPAQIAVALPGGAVMEMVWIPPGSFMMGSPQEEARMMPAEGPRHEVTISRGFYLGKYELTQAQWEAAMGTRPWVGQSYVKAHPDHPAVYITWDDVQALIQRLNEWEDREVYRMPTEAEWEYACRAGTSTRWSFGNEAGLLGDYAWFQDNTWSAGEPYAHPVGLLLPNPWGLYDMHGNVWEWVQDWLGDYSAEPQIDPQGPASGRYRVVRSGIFMAPPRGQRSAFRYAGNQDFPDGGVGVRLVRLAP